ncbi:histidine phosphatase family protein [Nitrincola tibetensis]|uniref:Histidine phosphatase family protein n=1 Tax=Nitrincola tibetensis TaxID=2219697 RepID=A0A364NR82_9GAMM|nr:histidine phosphatase family protein [Nitrincola tibetensis]RAU19554.1 histidine phosphatase family protein [Nitrincola tibetensis]
MFKTYLMLVFWVSALWPQLLLAQTSPTRFTPTLPATETLKQLNQGGFIFFLRHGPSDSSKPDQVPVDLTDCSTQRPLSDEGRTQMQQLGAQLPLLIPNITQIYSSPLCRAIDTIELVLPNHTYTIDDYLVYVAALTTEEKQPIIARTRELLATPPQAGENHLLVAHGPNLVEVMDYFPTEGALIIFKPAPQKLGFEYLGTIELDDWSSLISTME